MSQKYSSAIREKFMEAAIYEALKSPFVPTAGAIIVRERTIVGRGYRYVLSKDITKSGNKKIIHAEHAAIIDARNKTIGSDVYTTLEPCFKRSYGNCGYE